MRRPPTVVRDREDVFPLDVLKLLREPPADIGSIGVVDRECDAYHIRGRLGLLPINYRSNRDQVAPSLSATSFARTSEFPVPEK